MPVPSITRGEAIRPGLAVELAFIITSFIGFTLLCLVLMLPYQQCLVPFCVAIQRTKYAVFELATSKLFCNRLLTNRANVSLQTLAQIIFFIFCHWNSPLSRVTKISS